MAGSWNLEQAVGEVPDAQVYAQHARPRREGREGLQVVYDALCDGDFGPGPVVAAEACDLLQPVPCYLGWEGDNWHGVSGCARMS